jgi:arylsulfatase A-like enzyme
MNVIVLTIDRFHAGFLGCYGNTWVATPHFNRLASESFVFDQAYIDHPSLDELCQTWWTGSHCLRRQLSGGDLGPPPTLQSDLSRAGFSTACLTDEPVVADHPLAAGFDELLRLGFAAGDPQPSYLAEIIEQTQLARFFAATTQWLASAREPFFAWIHSRGLGGPWDAPHELRQNYAQEDEADPPDTLEPPCRYLTHADNPDDVWGLCQAYAGQVTLADECLGGLLELLEVENLAADTALIVLGARGFPLGRKGRLGPIDDALYGEVAQIPWLMRLPDKAGAAARASVLVQTCDLAPTILSLTGMARDLPHHAGHDLLPLIREDAVLPRDRICLVGVGGERALRTPAWYLRLPGGRSAEEPLPELYAKPDDRWEMNDVADRCPEIVAALQAAHDELAASLTADTSDSLTPLDESLVSQFR